MPKRTVITEIQVREIENTRNKNKDKNVERRLKVLLMHAAGKKRKEISSVTEYCEKQISNIVVLYVTIGLSAITENHYHGNHRNMSFEKEAEMLAEFYEEAEKGKVIEISKIKKAYEEKTGKSLEKSKGQIYRVLDRHNWRKVMPRSKHPKKASDEEIASSKKLTQN